MDENGISTIYVNFKVGNEFFTDLVEINGNVIQVPFKTDVLKEGTHQLEIVAYLKNGDVVPSPTFSYYVEKSLENTNNIEADTYYPILIDLLEKVEEWNERVVYQEEQRMANENERKSNEINRQSNENTRISNENTRQSNESSRQEYETQRRVEEDERLTDEQVRVNAEKTRQANEAQRIQAENTRSEFYEGFNDRLDAVDSQLAHIENNIDITPDDFEGSDVEKIQQALDYVVENNINTITLNRSYDLTGGIVYYNGKWAKPPTFKDGTLIKNDTGYMFSRLADNNNSNTPLFLNVTFIGNTENPCYIIDGDKLIRQGFDHCYFRGIGLIKTAGYLQSLRLHSCEMSFSPDIFINCSGAYDVSITNNKFEESHNALIKSYSDSTDGPACHALRITNNLIEGYVVEPPIILSSAYGLTISNNYFEANHCGDIEFITSIGIITIQGVI